MFWTLDDSILKRAYTAPTCCRTRPIRWFISRSAWFSAGRARCSRCSNWWRRGDLPGRSGSLGVNLQRAQDELDWAESRAKLVQDLAESVRREKAIASMESQAESHPEWAGKVYTRYEGSGIFTPDDLKVLEAAYTTRFSKPLPISADGETALHRSLGFDHRGRVDVAVTPDQPEGAWLMHYLESNHIPYFAFARRCRGRQPARIFTSVPEARDSRFRISYRSNHVLAGSCSTNGFYQ